MSKLRTSISRTPERHHFEPEPPPGVPPLRAGDSHHFHPAKQLTAQAGLVPPASR